MLINSAESQNTNPKFFSNNVFCIIIFYNGKRLELSTHKSRKNCWCYAFFLLLLCLLIQMAQKNPFKTKQNKAPNMKQGCRAMTLDCV